MIPQHVLDRLPTQPGVYVMKDEHGEVLYVGKANHLRSRVRQYFLGSDERPQIPYLVAKAVTVETIVVSSEKEALLLENTLIKQHQPKYNVFLKDDKGYISLMITKHRWPMIKLVRYKGTPKEPGRYFGPYTSAYAARQTLELLIRLFPLRRCSDRELKSRTRPCILYQIKRCVAPCVNKCTPEEYQEIVDRVIKFLQGKDHEVVKELEDKMHRASELLNFERAQELLETVHAIERTVEQQKVDQAGTGDRDVLGLYREGGEVSLSQLLFRDGKLVGAENYHFSSVAQDDDALMRSFLLLHYIPHDPLPHEILLPTSLENREALEEVLNRDKKRRSHLHTPQRGNKRALIEMAGANAKASFRKDRDLKTLREQTLLELQQRLKLENYPRRIECFDTSNLSGTEPVASMVAFTDGEKDKTRYRKYKLHQEKPDDYAAMREVLKRRLTRAQKEDDLPDLIIVDGGKGQLTIARDVLKRLNLVTVEVIALAKEGGRHDKGITAEQVFLPEKPQPIRLPLRSQPLFLLQRIRDEAHRFAITFQKKRREKATLRSALDTIPGIGPVKKRRLLQHFGSVKRILEATPDQLAEVRGLTQRDIATIREVSRGR